MYKKVIFTSIVLLALCAVGYGESSPLPIPPGFPTASDTGLAGVGLTMADLTDYMGPDTITTPGTVFYRKRIPNGLLIKTNGVIVRECYVGIRNSWGLDLRQGGSDLLVEDCLMIGRPSGIRPGAAVLIGSHTTRRCDISMYHDGLKMSDDTTIEDNYIHDLLREPYGDGLYTHNDGLQTGGGSNVIVRHNSVCGPYQMSNAAIFLKNASRDIGNYLIEDNFFSGGYSGFYAIIGPEQMEQFPDEPVDIRFRQILPIPDPQ